MDSPSAVDKAIEAHGVWKARLRAAIAAGGSEFIVAVVAEPDQCALGKWLHGPALARFGGHPRYRAVVESHAEFHAEAARILSMAKSLVVPMPKPRWRRAAASHRSRQR
jgi:hypothetical protein